MCIFFCRRKTVAFGFLRCHGGYPISIKQCKDCHEIQIVVENLGPPFSNIEHLYNIFQIEPGYVGAIKKLVIERYGEKINDC